MSGTGNDWIEINLPWRKHVEIGDRPEYPTELVNRLVRDRFGQTIEELEEGYFKRYGKSANEVYYDVLNELEEKHPFDPAVYEEEYDIYRREIENLIEHSDDPKLVESRTLSLMRRAIDEFVDEIPEVIEWTERCDKIFQQEREEEKLASFSYSELCRPGVLIEVQDTAGTKSKHLIGDINCNSGVCDDCTAFEPETIVLRAKVVVDTSDLQCE